MENRQLLASWLFLLGSALFMVEALADITQTISFSSLSHLMEGALFLVGSICFMPTARTEP